MMSVIWAGSLKRAHYAEGKDSQYKGTVSMLNVFMLNIFMLNVFMLNVFTLNVFMLNVVGPF